MAKIVVANFYPVYPVEHGGQRRIFFLSRELARDHHVTMVTLVRGRPMKYLQIAPRLVEIQVPAEDSYIEFERSLTTQVPMTADIAYAMKWASCRLYQAVLTQHVRDSQLAVSEHPYSFPALSKAQPSARRVPLIYNSQNVERRQKAPLLDGRQDLKTVVDDVEGSAVHQSTAMIACSEIDKEHFIAEYAAPSDKIAVVENGVDTKSVPRFTPEQATELRRHLGIDGKFVTVFGGSLHFPNLAAADAILELAEALPGVTFILLGSICRYSRLCAPVPGNVLVLGTVTEKQKWLSFAVGNLALNPMTLGSGSNIKMFEYAAAGIPILSTRFGARATGLEAGRHYMEAELCDFRSALERLQQADPRELKNIGEAAKGLVAESADWSVIGSHYRNLVSSIIGGAAAT